MRFSLESDNPEAHIATVRLSGLLPGRYAVHVGTLQDAKAESLEVTIIAGREARLQLPMAGGSRVFLLKRLIGTGAQR